MPTNWQWWIAEDPDYGYFGPYITKDEALSHAVLDGRFFEIDDDLIGIYICEARTHTINDIEINANNFLEDIEMNYDEWVSPDGDFFDPISKEDKDDLAKMLKETFHTWAKDHNISLQYKAFFDTRNEEIVKMPAAEHVKKIKND